MAKSSVPLCAMILLAASLSRAEDAIFPSGRQQTGQLQNDQGVWSFAANNGTKTPLSQLWYVRFPSPATPLPKTPLTRTLLLPNQQRVTGMLTRLDEKQVVFLTAWGKEVTLRRDQLVGIEQANDALPILHDDFDSSLKPWRIDGKIELDPERAFHGKASLLLDAMTKSATREWPELRDGTIRLFFQGSTAKANLRWAISLSLKKERALPPGIVIESDGCSCCKHEAIVRHREAVGRLALVVD